ncbi:MAG: hypothetical protein J5765_02605 [Clostridia bacterium]|nr:hypothetical protein [Clostridia bacterium]
MDRYGVKRVSGKGYENKSVIVRKGRRRDYPFLFFLLLFGGVIYLTAFALFRSATLPDPVRAAVSLLF